MNDPTRKHALNVRFNDIEMSHIEDIKDYVQNLYPWSPDTDRISSSHAIRFAVRTFAQDINKQKEPK